ncbi:MAG: hypothetical protein MHMPM18_001016 [Marteilia pararefringens]
MSGILRTYQGGSIDENLKQRKFDKCNTLHSLCLVTSFLVQGMYIATMIVNFHKQTKWDDLSLSTIILSIVLMATQFFSTLIFVWFRCKLSRTLRVLIAVFSNLMQIAILVVACINYHKNDLLASLMTSIFSLMFVCSWSCVFVKFTDHFDEYFNETSRINFYNEISCLNIFASAMTLLKQALIGVQSMMLQLQNPMRSDSCSVIYFILILIHLMFDIILISELWILESISLNKFDIKMTISSISLHFIIFIVCMILSYLGRSELTMSQSIICLITIVTFIPGSIFGICFVIRACRKHPNATSGHTMQSPGASTDSHTQSSNHQSAFSILLHSQQQLLLP